MAASPPTADQSAAGRSRDWPLSLRSSEATVLEQFVRAQAEATGGGEHPEKAVTLSQGELTRRTRLSQPSISRALMELQARGILEADGTHREGRGHPTTQWRVTEKFYVIGINIRDDFGTLGTPGRIQGVATALDGRRLGSPEPPHNLVEESASVDRVIERTINLIRQLPKEEGLDAKVGRLIGVGVSLGGHVYAGHVIRSHNLGWRGVALQERLHHALSAHRLVQVPVIVENNATSFAASLNPVGDPRGGAWSPSSMIADLAADCFWADNFGRETMAKLASLATRRFS